LLLYVDGDPQVLSRRCIAIVGSRHATPAGKQHAHAFAQALASAGWAIVSGLARGIDAAAHEGALASGGVTAAIVGTGLDIVYPGAHRSLARRIATQGALVSEFPPGTPPLAEHFPQRNRIIAGVCAGVLVVEAAVQSGSLITARLAAEAGREVFAVPGSIDSPQSRGCHVLIKQGAKLVETLEDILDELVPGGVPQAAAVDATSAEEDAAGPSDDPVLRALGHDPATLDALCARMGWPVSELSARLLEHELRGDVARLPGGLYQRIRRT
jgi:DNA processing protein